MEEILNTKVSELLAQGMWFVVAAVGLHLAAQARHLVLVKPLRRRGEKRATRNLLLANGRYQVVVRPQPRRHSSQQYYSTPQRRRVTAGPQKPSKNCHFTYQNAPRSRYRQAPASPEISSSSAGNAPHASRWFSGIPKG